MSLLSVNQMQDMAGTSEGELSFRSHVMALEHECFKGLPHHTGLVRAMIGAIESETTAVGSHS